jgi:hypothetical protein
VPPGNGSILSFSRALESRTTLINPGSKALIDLGHPGEDLTPRSSSLPPSSACRAPSVASDRRAGATRKDYRVGSASLALPEMWVGRS